MESLISDVMIVFRKRQFRERSLNLSLLFVRDAGSSQRPTVDLSAEPKFMFMFLYRVLEAVQS